MPTEKAFSDTFARRARSACDLLITFTRYSSTPNAKEAMSQISHGPKLKLGWESTFFAGQPPHGATDVNVPLTSGW